MASDLTQTGQALLYALINAANPSLPNGPINAANATLGTPGAPTGGTGNTGITLTAVANNGYANSVNLTYNRLDIQTDVIAVLAPSGATLVNNSFATVADLIAPLNTAYNLGLVAGDVANGTDPISLTNGAGSATLNIASGSLKYTGSLVVTITQTQVDLASVVTVTDLNGLIGP